MLEPYWTPRFDEEAALDISRDLSRIFTRRRTIRSFSKDKPNIEIIKNAVDVARLAPSGANKQPWNFSIVDSPAIKEQIRELSEIEEYRFYVEKPNEKWVNDLKHLHCKKREAVHN